LIKIIILIK